jgi:hypothetical protein
MNAYAGVPFQNSIEGGGNIIIPFLQSPNFVPGVSGWRISRNGDAEFASQTLRGPLIVIDPLTGLVVASIGQTGTIAGQFLTIEDDIILAGESLGDRLQDGRGLVGFKGFGAGNNPPAPGPGGPPGTYTDTAWFRFPARGGRLYQIFSTTMTLVNTSSFSEEFETRWLVTDSNGNGPTPISSYKDHPDNFMSYQAPSVLIAIDSNPLVTATLTCQLQSRQVTSGTDLTFSNTDGWNIFALDIGPLSGAMNDGGTGAATGSEQVTTIFPATLSRSYNGSGNEIIGTTDLWRSDFGDGNGATTSMCIFNGAAIRAALASAISIQSATLNMFCTTAEDSNGSLAFDPATNTSLPATQATFTGGEHVFENDWPVPGWRAVNILTGEDFLNDILPPGNANAMKISAALFGGNATRFAGASVANRPYISITYTIP